MIQMIESIDKIMCNPELVDQINGRSDQLDICYDLDYLKQTTCAYDGTLHIAFQVDREQYILYPFILRPIDGVCGDIITPFEYGGPVGQGGEDFIDAFAVAFEQFCQTNNLVSEFIRFHPLLTDPLQWRWINAEFSCNNVMVDLKQSGEDIFSNYHKNNRRDIRLAERSGVTISSGNASKENMESFVTIYYETMDMRKADPFYYFSEQYFKNLTTLNEENVQIYFSELDGKHVGAAIILRHGGIAHYHLSGTLREASKACPNNLLLHTAIMDARSKGDRLFHLGGAAKMESGLYQFKSKFSRTTTPYFIGKRIIDKTKYSALSEKWGREIAGRDSGSYFPSYRAPAK